MSDLFSLKLAVDSPLSQEMKSHVLERIAKQALLVFHSDGMVQKQIPRSSGQGFAILCRQDGHVFAQACR
jgi:hypothetical protein